MKRTLKPGLSVATILLFAAGCASVSPPSETPTTDGFSYSDSSAAWSRLDTDGDDHLDQDELWQQRALALMQDFESADANQDARVSRAEWDLWWPRLDRSAVHPGFVQPGESKAP
jgi:hypothetical protein